MNKRICFRILCFSFGDHTTGSGTSRNTVHGFTELQSIQPLPITENKRKEVRLRFTVKKPTCYLMIIIKIRRDLLALMYKAIDHLEKVDKAILFLFLEKRSYDEIASIMGITKSNVGVKLNRIKKKIEKLIPQVSD